MTEKKESTTYREWLSTLSDRTIFRLANESRCDASMTEAVNNEYKRRLDSGCYLLLSAMALYYEQVKSKKAEGS